MSYCVNLTPSSAEIAAAELAMTDFDRALHWHMFCTQWRWIALEAEHQRNVPLEIIYASWFNARPKEFPDE